MSAEDAVAQAVEAAIEAGWTPRRFVQEASSAWVRELAQRAKDADTEFNRMTAPRVTG